MHSSPFLAAALAAAAALASCTAPPGPDATTHNAREGYRLPPAGTVRILRDGHGVPHILASEERSLFFGAGYAQAEDQLENLCKNYLRAAGRLASVAGESELANDRVARALRFRERAAQWYDTIDPEIRAHFEAFAAGVNHYIAANRASVPAWVRPVVAHDVVAFGMFADLMFPVLFGSGELRAAGRGVRRLVGAARAVPAGLGSNQFAVAPSRSQTGAAMISMDPHLRLGGVMRWHEMHLVGPDINVFGATFSGLPYVGLGRTATSAWCQTVSGPDRTDFFAFRTNPANPRQYRDVGGWREFEERRETFLVVNERSIERRTLTVRDTVLGPVFAEGEGVVYVLAVPWPESLRSIRQYYDMARARDLDAFQAALAQQGVSMFNFLYADAQGHIFYASNMRAPVRDTRIDAAAIRPGDQAWARWRGLHAFAELPQITDPSDGFLLNTNSGPHNVFPGSPLKPGAFPPYMTGHDRNDRWRRLTGLLRKDTSVTWEEMRRYAADTYLLAADRWAPLALRLLEQHGEDLASDEVTLARLEACAELIRGWDRRTDVDSRGAVLFAHLAMDRELQRSMQGSPDAKALVAAVLRVADHLEKTFGRLDVAWGEFSRIRRGEVELPCAGHAGLVGVALRPSRGSVAPNGRRYVDRGSSYNMIVDFSGATRAASCQPFGNSDDPTSPHHTDQMQLYAVGRQKPVWFTPGELAEHVESLGREVRLEVPQGAPPGPRP